MKAINLFLLAAMIGVELILGIVVAPVIFYPQDLIGEGVLSRFQSGLMMSKIFTQMSFVLVVVSVLHFLFELYSFFKNTHKFQLRFSTLMLSILILLLSLVFTFYFIPTILSLQSLGENMVASSEFQSIHSASEVVIKILAMLQVFLYFLSFKYYNNSK
ncbi:DUF4149 domain-containing protein [Campylobacter sp. MIT 21-1685]|uniref:DUF4149 domain-containing protein n=1 Tax=unclassified Campylobacter TaxID=2593542 RepID=UPI00224AC20A|nr:MULTISPECIES: DUF4149 domain-containing protein [unclassified Campylobacter]MCX2682734.1 DUF4149 domain-containing protein [Campylobacter sp. MIT 21-1684]MCX2751120.1 DUF4149 domain-containing protein [Campylobacter sp. MIT 21-1682]MCX2807215.1 DUF4149 domain-containing protein [Campylobacter sp. MIT 21-1685]